MWVVVGGGGEGVKVNPVNKLMRYFYFYLLPFA